MEAELPTRRTLIIAGGKALAATNLGYRAWDRGVGLLGQDPAYSPGVLGKGAASEGLLRPVRAAILAANPHDMQPWLFEVEPGAIIVSADRARNLGSFDPFRREMHLGVGAAIENLVLAASFLCSGSRAEAWLIIRAA